MNPVNDPLVVRFTYDGTSEPKFVIITQDESVLVRNSFSWRCLETRIVIESCNNPEINIGSRLFLRGCEKSRDHDHKTSNYTKPAIQKGLDDMAKAVSNLNKYLKQQQIERTEVPF